VVWTGYATASQTLVERFFRPVRPKLPAASFRLSSGFLGALAGQDAAGGVHHGRQSKETARRWVLPHHLPVQPQRRAGGRRSWGGGKFVKLAT
jgi:hypothetical protein